MNRVWVYQADRFLTDVEVSSVEFELDSFIKSWTAHGSTLLGTANVLDNLFIVIQVDERQAGVTGCSIDKSVNFLKSLSSKFNVDFFDRMKVSYIDSDNKVNLVDRKIFEDLLNEGVVGPETIVFNNLVQNSDELASNWRIPFKDSWHSKVF